MSDMAVYQNPYGDAAQVMSAAPSHDSGNALVATSEARAVAQVKAQIIMARQFPRDPAAAMDRIFAECKRPKLAESATYAFVRGRESVTGPSIRLAEVIARNWGNMEAGYTVLDRSNGRSVVSAFAWDLETNLRSEIQFEVKHWRQTRSGGYPLKEDRDIYELEANMAARRKRACILQLIPGDVVDAAVDACRATTNSKLVQSMEDPKKRDATVRRLIDLFVGLGVSEGDLTDYIKVPAAEWTADHVAKLYDIYNGIKDNATDMGSFFPRLAHLEGNDTISKEQVKQIMEHAKATGHQQDLSDWLKAQGIAKVADTPKDKFEDVIVFLAGLSSATEAQDGQQTIG